MNWDAGFWISAGWCLLVLIGGFATLTRPRVNQILWTAEVVGLIGMGICLAGPLVVGV